MESLTVKIVWAVTKIRQEKFTYTGPIEILNPMQINTKNIVVENDCWKNWQVLFGKL